MVALLGASAGDFGVIRERVTYSSYGVPQGFPAGDINIDGAADTADDTLWYTLSAGAYDVRADFDLDGDLDGDMDWNDEILMAVATSRGLIHVRGIMTQDNGLDYAVGNRKGYAGYEHDGVFNTLCHVRNRVLLTELGRWSRRDPLGYVDGMGLYEFVSGRAIRNVDRLGLKGRPAQSDGAVDIDQGGDCLGKILAKCNSRFCNISYCERASDSQMARDACDGPCIGLFGCNLPRDRDGITAGCYVCDRDAGQYDVSCDTLRPLDVPPPTEFRYSSPLWDTITKCTKEHESIHRQSTIDKCNTPIACEEKRLYNEHTIDCMNGHSCGNDQRCAREKAYLDCRLKNARDGYAQACGNG